MRTVASGSLTRAFVATTALWLSLVLAGVVVPNTHGAFGDRFSFAPVSANGTTALAFPGTTSFWAGVCDLEDGTAAVGTLPSDLPDPRTFADCIDHPVATRSGGIVEGPATPLPVDAGPLPPGALPSGPDGWGRIESVAGGFTPADGPSWRLGDVTAAGAHPDGSASFWFARSLAFTRSPFNVPHPGPEGLVRNVRVALPLGVVGNPTAVPMCGSEHLRTAPTTCPPKSQVGTSTINFSEVTGTYPVYNVEPRDGKTAEFIISGVGLGERLVTDIPVVASARTDGDFGVDAAGRHLPAAATVNGQTFTIWGVPWAASHDRYRPIAAYCGTDGSDGVYADTAGGAMSPYGLKGGFGGSSSTDSCSQEPQSYDPSWGPIKPFLSTQTECTKPDPTTRVFADNWQTATIAKADSVAPRLDSCRDIRFDPRFGLATTSTAADSASGLDVDLTVPQNNDPPESVQYNADDDTGAPAHWKSPAGRATSHLKDSVVTLPDGFSVNPSSATGLDGCSDAQIGVTNATTSPPLFNNDDPFDGAGSVECPQGSVIGTAEVTVPLLREKLTGHVVLGAPKSTDPQSGEMFRMFLVVGNDQRGLLAKIYGSAVADPSTGRLTATFANNPQVPFDNLKLSFKGGQRGILATPRRCAEHGWTSRFSPWSGNAAVPQGGQFATNANCANGFSPALQAGMDSRAARGHGTFAFRFSRSEGEQYLRGLTATLPKGLLASVKGVPLCSNAAAAGGSCPAGSKIGIVDAKAGAGDPFVLEEKGEVFLTEGYKGGEYGLAVKIRPIAGPFRGAMELSPIVVRQAIHVDRKSAQVTAISDPFPLIHHGVPLRVREVTVLVNRARFMLNPSDCSQKRVGAAIVSDEGATADLLNGFQAAGCRNLAFKPRLGLRLTGRRQVKTGKHPGIRAVVRQRGIPEAGIRKAEVRLPKTLALDVDNAQALCEFEDGTKPNLERHCPKGSIVGRSRAVSPLLNRPLVGNVYFVKNVRRSSSGNLIRTLPMIIVALRGEISVNLVGESNVKRGKLVNTFDNVPDAPISRFNLNIKGGKNGILAVTRTRRGLINLCKAGRQIAEADMDGQNGRVRDFNVRMRKPCAGKKRAGKGGKRKASKRGKAGSRR